MAPDDEYAQFIAPIEDQMIHSVWRIVRDADDAKDAFQEALIRIWKRWPKVTRHINPHAYILRTCVTCAFDQLRRRRRGRSIQLNSVAETLHDPEALPSDRLIARERHDELIMAIAELPRMQRLVVHMRFVDGLSFAEIAEAFAVGEATVRKHVFRARKRLQSMLRDRAVESHH